MLPLYNSWYVNLVSWLMIMNGRGDSKIYPFSCSMDCQFSHIIFYSSLKFGTIFMYILWITDNTAALLFRAITMTEPHYAIALFQSCPNLLLYLIYFLCSLQISCPTVSKVDSPTALGNLLTYRSVTSTASNPNFLCSWVHNESSQCCGKLIGMIRYM